MANNLTKENYDIKQGDLYTCDVVTSIAKDIIPQLEYPFYSLSKNPIKDNTRYEYKDKWIEIQASSQGQATIYDKDIMICIISNIVQMQNDKESITTSHNGEIESRTVRIYSDDILKFTNKQRNTSSFKSLDLSLKRLMGTVISTNITESDEHDVEYFHLIEQAGIKRKYDSANGKILYIDVKISDWMRKSIENKQILTLHRDYFRLPSPVEKGIYEIVRKHLGKRKKWNIFLKTLHEKLGTRASIRELRRTIKKLEEKEKASEYTYFPDYKVIFNREEDKIYFENKNNIILKVEGDYEFPEYSPDTYTKAFKAAPSYSKDEIYGFKENFETWWLKKGCPSLNKDKIENAFVGFCKTKEEQNKNKQGSLV